MKSGATMESSVIKSLFDQFSSQYDWAHKAEVWKNQSETFKRFWNDKILNPTSELTVEDTDRIIRLLDIKARGHQKTDEAVALTFIRQGLWERLFDQLRNKKNIQQTLNQIFAETDDARLIELLDRLKQENQNNGNGLTGGKSAVVINTLLFINNPAKFLSMVSLQHRFQLMRAFGLGTPDEFRTFGEEIVLSNRRIIDGFRDKYGIEADPRALSEFFYTPFNGYTTKVKGYWQRSESTITEPAEEEVSVISQGVGEVESVAEFAMEKHLEDFLIRNWESTELGKKYELIEEDGEFVSQQYRTEVGSIDLLVRDKETKQFVVIELKKGQTSDDTVGQITRYMGWVKRNRASGQEVKGIIIARANDLRLQYALEMVRNVELFVYKVSFALEKANGF
jgi:Holliday junction resolvase-like predicted endonuclease